MQLNLKLTEDKRTPLYKRVSDALRRAIIDGTVKPGRPLPSSRQLAESMNISRLTITRSYEDLASQGWITILERGKTFVSSDVERLTQPSQLDLFKQSRGISHVEPAWSAFARRVEKHAVIVDPSDAEQAFGAPRAQELPISLWRQCVNSAVRSVSNNISLRDYNLGYMPLRKAVHGLLARTRGVQCAVSDVVIHARTAGGIDLLCRLLLETGDPVAVEDPGSELVRSFFAMQGMRIFPIGVDEKGIKVNELAALPVPPKLLYVCPSRHDPSGVVMDEGRRKELLKWAAGSKTWILEDDFDCEFRYGEKPAPSLQSLDQHGLVVYRYNFWKAMYPLVRLSVNVLPPNVVPTFARANSMLYRDVPLVEQAALAEFIDAGHFERHIQKRHKQCARRRAALILEMTRAFGQKVRIGEVTSGTDARLVFDSAYDLSKLLDAAVTAELPLVATAQKYYKVTPIQNEFTLNFSNIPESDIPALVQKFRREVDAIFE